MNTAATRGRLNRIVLVVGIDLGEQSQHLLSVARALARGADETELHVVHVVAPESFGEVLFEPLLLPRRTEEMRAQNAALEIEALCRRAGTTAGAHVVVHTPAGRPVEQIVRVAREVAADAIIVEAHDHGPRMFHRSTAAELTRSAPCSVVTIRAPRNVAAAPTVQREAFQPSPV
jgi:nucleotide-binding universal stress UspA family protein